MNKQNWIEKSHDSWSVFKIMGELVEGYEKLSELGPCVSIFGSARTQEDDPFYKQTVKIAKKIVGMGLGVITGGGPGIMEAANKGAQQAGGISVGLNIDLPFEQTHNEFIDSDKLIDFDYFFVRKVMYVRYAQAFIDKPGEFGTVDEIIEGTESDQSDYYILATITGIPGVKTITNDGGLYTTDDIIKITGGGQQAAMQISDVGSGKITDIFVDAGGSGYEIGDTLTFTNTGTEGNNAAGVVTVVNGAVAHEDGDHIVLEDETSAGDHLTGDKIVFESDTGTGDITDIYLTNLNLSWLINCYKESKNKNVFFNSFFDKLAGTDRLRLQIKEGMTEREIRKTWEQDLNKFKEIRKKYLIY